MASLQQRNGVRNCIVRIRVKRRWMNLGDVSDAEAEAVAAKVDYCLLQVDSQLSRPHTCSVASSRPRRSRLDTEGDARLRQRCDDQKEIITLRTCWNIGIPIGLIEGKFPSRGIRFAKMDAPRSRRSPRWNGRSQQAT